MSEATVHIDGGSRGNPGPASYALVLRRPGHDVWEECDRLGNATNNVAEYTALIKALERAKEFGVTSLAVFSDSELLVKQMQKLYKVKNLDLQGLYRKADDLRQQFDAVTFTHVRRNLNADADRLCNEALDGRPKPPKRQPWEHLAEASSSLAALPNQALTAPNNALEAEAVACLANAAKSWAERGAHDPDPAEVWRRLALILTRHDVPKPGRL